MKKCEINQAYLTREIRAQSPSIMTVEWRVVLQNSLSSCPQIAPAVTAAIIAASRPSDRALCVQVADDVIELEQTPTFDQFFADVEHRLKAQRESSAYSSAYFYMPEVKEHFINTCVRPEFDRIELYYDTYRPQATPIPPPPEDPTTWKDYVELHNRCVENDRTYQACIKEACASPKIDCTGAHFPTFNTYITRVNGCRAPIDICLEQAD